MKVTNPQGDRAILACIVDQVTGDAQWHEIPAGETVEVEDFVVASTLCEHGATASKAELEAARELWAEQNRAVNSRTASASSSEGVIIGRRQATVDVATGTSTTELDVLKGDALKAAVAEANAAGAKISGKADEQREQLAAWQKSRGSSSPVDDEFLVDDKGGVVTGEDGQPIPLALVQLDGEGKAVYDVDGAPVLKSVDAPDVNATDAAVAAAAGGDHSGQDEVTAQGQE